MARVTPVIGLALLCTTGGAFAADPPANVPGARHVSSAPALVDGFGQAVTASTLQHYSGGSLVQNNQTITGAVTGNTASDLTTGANSISGNSLDGASGLPSVVQNTGNNVLIQTGVIVNVQLKP
ncbi:hypothetical protein [Dyella sp.]|uniref:hypothetical protein n=1 Tax=Dyella sp. TaxID=1869338 RepID=UPI002FDA5282